MCIFFVLMTNAAHPLQIKITMQKTKKTLKMDSDADPHEYLSLVSSILA